MTDYNDGKWYGWNGGKCPVHPKSLVEVRWKDFLEGSAQPSNLAGYWVSNVWEHEHGDATSGRIIAFRVVKPYKEPRDRWALEHAGWMLGSVMWDTKEEAIAQSQRFTNARVVHLKEVTND